jgi:ABC-2 type transport system permease protein
MQTYLTLTRRELASFFASITGYVIIAGVVFVMGLSFVDILEILQGDSTSVPVTQLYFRTSYFWEILLLAAPVTTMRLFALEKFSGTFESLMTAPVSDLQVVLAKFTAAMVFYTLMWLPSLLSIFILRHYLNRADAFDPGLLAGTFLGVFLLGCLFISVGCLASSLTKSQIVAAMISFTMSYSMFLLSALPEHVKNVPDWAQRVVSHIGMFDHMNDFTRGLVDTSSLVFYLSGTVLFLFLTLRVVESRRWK